MSVADRSFLGDVVARKAVEDYGNFRHVGQQVLGLSLANVCLGKSCYGS